MIYPHLVALHVPALHLPSFTLVLLSQPDVPLTAPAAHLADGLVRALRESQIIKTDKINSFYRLSKDTA